MAGTSAARYLRRWGGSGLTLTLVERNTAYTSNIMSNGVLTGQTTIPSLQYSYAALRNTYGVNVVTAEALGVNPTAQTVTLSNGSTLGYDRLVVAPGIVFDALPGLTVGDYDTTYPHAWQAGAQTTLLRNQLMSMPSGGTFVMTIPPAPYRCPRDPTSVPAWWLTGLRRTSQGAASSSWTPIPRSWPSRSPSRRHSPPSTQASSATSRMR